MNRILNPRRTASPLRRPGPRETEVSGDAFARLPRGTRLTAFLSAALLLLFSAGPSVSSAEEPSDVPAAETTAAGTETPPPAPAKAYVLVTTASQMGFLPLPETEDYLFPLTQTLPDGTVAENVIHVSPDGVWMESSNCENQDCVQEGTVTLENRRDRILGNWIICLPHQLTLQLLTPEEVLAMMTDSSSAENP